MLHFEYEKDCFGRAKEIEGEIAMKKVLSLALAMLLLLSCAATAMAAPHDWCYRLPDDAVFAFDYNNSVALVASKIYNTTPQKITRYFSPYECPFLGGVIYIEYPAGQIWFPDSQIAFLDDGPKDPLWITTRFYGAGFEAKQLTNTASDMNFVPVDLTREGTIVYPIATDSGVVCGFFWTKVKDGKLSVDYQLNQGEIHKIGQAEVAVYTSKNAVRTSAPDVICIANHQIDIAEDLGGAQAALVSLNGALNYCKNVFAGKITWTEKIPYIDYEEPVPGMIVPVTKYETRSKVVNVNYTLQDYWPNAPYWVSYRAGLQGALDMVAE